MPLQAPTPRRERILMFGPPGSGKTSAWLNIATWLQSSGSGARVFCLDTDRALEAFVYSPAFAQLLPDAGGPLHYAETFEWNEYTDHLSRFLQLITPEDWLVVDFVSPAWDAVQSYFIEEVFAANPAEYFLEARKAKAGGNPLDGWRDWSVINRLYKGWMNQILNKNPGHLFLTATPDVIQDNADRATRAMFGAYGVRPRGQKDLGFQTHTVLMSQVLKPGEVYLTTIKDRERQPVEGLRVNQFALDYLVNVAGWSLA